MTHHSQVKEERGSQLNSEEVAAHLRRIWHARKKSERAAAEKTKEEGGEGGAGEFHVPVVMSSIKKLWFTLVVALLIL